jgi:hypothetical protein
MKMATVISDRALDLGRFALDYELESGTDYIDIVHNAPLKQSVNISTRPTSSKRNERIQATTEVI